MLGAGMHRDEPPAPSSIRGEGAGLAQLLREASIFSDLRRSPSKFAYPPAGRGLAKSGGKCFFSRPAIAKGQLAQLSAKGWGGDLVLIALICWAFSRRVSSECWPLARQRPGETLRADSRLERKAVSVLADRKLIIELRRRKDMTGGSRVTRGCICED